MKYLIDDKLFYSNRENEKSSRIYSLYICTYSKLPIAPVVHYYLGFLRFSRFFSNTRLHRELLDDILFDMESNIII